MVNGPEGGEAGLLGCMPRGFEVNKRGAEGEGKDADRIVWRSAYVVASRLRIRDDVMMWIDAHDAEPGR